MNLKLKPYPKLNKLARYALELMFPFVNDYGIEYHYGKHVNYERLVSAGLMFGINELTIQGLFVENPDQF